MPSGRWSTCAEVMVVRLSPFRSVPFVGCGPGFESPRIDGVGAWPTVVGSVAHPADKGGVRRAVVKIYHDRNIDRGTGMWRASQGKADKEQGNTPNPAARVTGSLSGFERPLSGRLNHRDHRNHDIRVDTRVSWRPPSHR
ncbi:protein of unknown function [Streptomyces murinus]